MSIKLFHAWRTDPDVPDERVFSSVVGQEMMLDYPKGTLKVLFVISLNTDSPRMET